MLSGGLLLVFLARLDLNVGVDVVSRLVVEKVFVLGLILWHNKFECLVLRGIDDFADLVSGFNCLVGGHIVNHDIIVLGCLFIYEF